MRASLPQGLKPQCLGSLAAGLKACSTPWGTVNGIWKHINACSTPWGLHFANTRSLRPTPALMTARARYTAVGMTGHGDNDSNFCRHEGVC